VVSLYEDRLTNFQLQLTKTRAFDVRGSCPLSEEKCYIAIDVGAESGRVILGGISDGKLTLAEYHRFVNGPIRQGDSLRWDFGKLFSEIKAGIAKTLKKNRGNVAGIGIDCWGVDFGLLDEKGQLLENPYHYRDSRTDGMMEKAFAMMDKRQIYNNTGIQLMQLNTVYQLLAMKFAEPEKLARAKHLMFMSDLFTYFLCGQIFSEYTQASTSQLMNMRTGQWCQPIFDKLKLPVDIMPNIVRPATVIGRLKSQLAAELGCPQIPVIAVGAHDTASAVAAVPARQENWAYLSSGTWSLMGIEVDKPIINDQTYEYQFTNEGGVEDSIRLLKNIMGLWLVQECRRQWRREGAELSYDQLEQMASKAKAFAGYIEPDQNDFLSPGDMPAKINNYLKKTKQQAIEDKGQMIRIILEALALKYREVLGKLQQMSGGSIEVMHIVGGGIKNQLLCQFTAEATGKKVVTGPDEATAAGNIIVQAIATGQIKSLAEGREIVRNSFEFKHYLPQDTQTWQQKYKQIIRGEL